MGYVKQWRDQPWPDRVAQIGILLLGMLALPMRDLYLAIVCFGALGVRVYLWEKS